MILLMIPLLLLAGCAKSTGDSSSDPSSSSSLPASSNGESGYIELTFDYEKQSGYSSNQFAVWIADSDGNIVKTLYVTKFRAEGGYEKRDQALRNWVAAVGPASLSDDEVDAFSTATPKSGAVSIKWNLTDIDGNSVLDGDYTIYLEGTIFESDHVLYGAKFSVPALQESGGLSYYDELESGKNADMIKNVQMHYFPASS